MSALRRAETRTCIHAHINMHEYTDAHTHVHTRQRDEVKRPGETEVEGLRNNIFLLLKEN